MSKLLVHILRERGENSLFIYFWLFIIVRNKQK